MRAHDTNDGAPGNTLHGHGAFYSCGVTAIILIGMLRTTSVTLVMLVTALAACGQPNRSGQGAVSGGTESVELTVGHRSEWRVLWVEGKTNLPDGAYVNYRVTHELARTSPLEDWPATNLIESGRGAVKDGAYWAKINTLRWPSGTVRILVQFPLPPQPQAVVDRYGEFGEHLTGAHVTELNGMKAVEVEHTFEHQR